MNKKDKRDLVYLQTIISFCGINGLNEEGLKRWKELIK